MQKSPDNLKCIFCFSRLSNKLLKLAIVVAVAEKFLSHSLVFDSVANSHFVISKNDLTRVFKPDMKLPDIVYI